MTISTSPFAFSLKPASQNSATISSGTCSASPRWIFPSRIASTSRRVGPVASGGTAGRGCLEAVSEISGLTISEAAGRPVSEAGATGKSKLDFNPRTGSTGSDP